MLDVYKRQVQDAHEAIRPTSVMRTPEKVKPFLKPDEFKLYSLIYKRTLAVSYTQLDVYKRQMLKKNIWDLQSRKIHLMVQFIGMMLILQMLKMSISVPMSMISPSREMPWP